MRKKKAHRRLAMMPSELSRRVACLPANGHVRLQANLVGWFAEYDTPGAYGRLILNHTAEFAYNNLQSATGLLWLSEALDVPGYALVKARSGVRKARATTASEAAAVRRVLPWALIEALLKARS